MESICLCTHAARVLCAAVIIMRGSDEREIISYDEVVPIPFAWGSQVLCLRQTLDRTWISVGPDTLLFAYIRVSPPILLYDHRHGHHLSSYFVSSPSCFVSHIARCLRTWFVACGSSRVHVRVP